MRNQVKIGEGCHTNYSAQVLLKLSPSVNISSNPTSYWIWNLYLNIDLIIMKDTAEGKHLTDLLVTDCTDVDFIREYLIDVLLEHATLTQIKGGVDDEIHKAYQQGYNEKTKEIRKIFEFY